MIKSNINYEIIFLEEFFNHIPNFDLYKIPSYDKTIKILFLLLERIF